jgi:hypothetical protein
MRITIPPLGLSRGGARKRARHRANARDRAGEHAAAASLES